MLNNSVFKSRTVLVICIAVLALVTGLASGRGSPQANENINNSSETPAPIIVPSAIVAAAKSFADEPMRGKVYYYCDCKAGAASGCKAGNDANTGTDPTAPRQTLGNATAGISSFTGDTNHTIAFCKGGSFTSVNTNSESINRTGCTAGTDCDDMREYASPAFTSSATPILNGTVSGQALIRFMGNYGGVRIMNLVLKDLTGNTGVGVWTGYGAHDVTIANNTISDFSIGINWAGDTTVAPSIRMHMRGNTVTNSKNIAFLGGASNSDVSYNYFEGNGKNTIYDHDIYVSANEAGGLSHIDVVGNYVHGQYGSTCVGNSLSMHGLIDYFNITDNTVVIDADKVRGGCTGISVSPANYTVIGYDHLVVARNTLINTGATALDVGNAPGAVIEDNLIIQNWAYGNDYGSGVVSQWTLNGISLQLGTQRAQDELNTADVVRNNTVWFGPNVLGGATGINAGDGGTGYIFANNTVTYSSASIGQGVGCYAYLLPNTSFAFVNNNHCYSAASGSYWRVKTDTRGNITNDSTRLSLSAWQSYAATQGWDSASVGGAPNFVNATASTGYDFHPNANPALTLSPLLGKGDPAKAPKYDLPGSSEFSNPPAIGAYK